MITNEKLVDVLKKVAALHEMSISFGGQQNLDTPTNIILEPLHKLYSDPLDETSRRAITTLLGVHSSEQAPVLADLISGLLMLRIKGG